MFLMDLLVVAGAILDTPIRVMDEFGLSSSAFDCHLQRPADLFRLQAAMHMVAHDPSGVGIRDQAEISKLLPSRNVGDVSHPNFLWPCSNYLLRALLEQVRVFTESMMAIRRLVIRAFGWHKEARNP